jgi:Uma2 family endonuclease
MSALPQHQLTAEAFLAWATAQAQGRYELVGGRVVAMAPERAGHNLVKLAVARELGDAVGRAGAPCTVFTDGMSLAIDAETVREPDASVQCNGSVDVESTRLLDPIIVVEVVSPSSERDDTVDKLVEYFSVPTIQHYLIVRPDRGLVIHHSREASAKIATTIVSDGDLSLDPPGLKVSVPRLLGKP